MYFYWAANIQKITYWVLHLGGGRSSNARTPVLLPDQFQRNILMFVKPLNPDWWSILALKKGSSRDYLTYHQKLSQWKGCCQEVNRNWIENLCQFCEFVNYEHRKVFSDFDPPSEECLIGNDFIFSNDPKYTANSLVYCWKIIRKSIKIKCG